MTAPARLSKLHAICREYPGRSAEKLDCIRRLSATRFARANELEAYHELLCFLRAYPDDAELLAAVESALAGFEQRRELRRFAHALTDSGIAGTPIHFPFYWLTAASLAKNWPERLFVDWPACGDTEREHLSDLLASLVPYAEAPDLELGLSLPAYIARMKGEHETDASFLLRRFAALRMEPRTKEALYNSLRLPLRLDPGVGGPSRTRAFHPPRAVAFQTQPLSRERPSLHRAVRMRPKSVRSASRREANALIALAREAMITRSRELDAFMYASPDDVRVVDAGDGLELACFGLVPEQRALIETIYVFLLLKNGVPIGYYQAALLFGSAELNYNVFSSFRGGETALVYARALGVVRHLFGVDTFSVHPYQLGRDNPEALRSGAFWFYEKLGYRPDERRVAALLAREKKRIAKHPEYRSSPATLLRLASGYLFFHLRSPRDDVAGKVSLSRVSLAITDHLAERFGADRELALETTEREARRALSLRPSALSKGERIAFRSWAPLVATLGAERWSLAERRALGALVRAKGADREQDFARHLTLHGRLRRALLELSRRPVKNKNEQFHQDIEKCAENWAMSEKSALTPT